MVGGNVTLGGSSTYSGATNINAGKLLLASAGALPTNTALTVQAGTLALGGKTQTVGAYTQSGGIVENGTLTLNSGSFNLNGGSVSAVLAGSAGAVVGGNVTLGGSSTYSGATSINAGKLLLAQSGALPTTTALTVAQGGTFNLGGRSQTVDAVVLNGGLVEAGTLTGRSYTFGGGTVSASLAGPGLISVTGTVTLSGANTSSGATTLASTAELTVANTAALANSPVVYNDGTIVFASGISAATFGGLTGSKSLALTNAASAPAPVALTVTSSTDATYAGLLSGAGSFTKAGAGNLTLSQTPSYLGATTVSAGSLTLGSGDLLNGSRSITNDGTINLTLSTGLTYSGTLSGNGTLNLTAPTAVAVTLGTLGIIQGNLVLANISLDVSQAGITGVNPATSFTLQDNSQLTLNGAGQRLELLNLVLTAGSKLNATSGTILYDNAPVYLNGSARESILSANNQLLPAYAGLVSGSLTFEENSKRGSIFAAGTYEYIAGRVKDLPSDAKRLLLDPQNGKTVRISTAIPDVAQEVVATATGIGFVSVGTLVTTPRFAIGSGIQATFTQEGALSANGVFANTGTLQFSVLSGNKVVSNLISGEGMIEKIDAGTLIISGANTYSGPTRLSDGVLQINNSGALGTGTIQFNGGGLKYGSNVDTDLSRRIAAIGADTVATIDTGTSSVTFALGLTGAGGITKQGAGTLVLAGANSFSGLATVKAGNLQVGSAASAGSLVAAAAVDSGAFLRFLQSSNLTYSGSLSGAGTVEQAGADVLRLAGENSAFAGTLLLTQGTVSLASSTASGSSAVSLVFNGGALRYETGITTDVSAKIARLAGGTAKIDTGANTVSFGAALSGVGGLTKLGSGTLELLAANAFSGPTTVAAGLLRSGTTLANTSAINVNGGTFEAVSYNPAAVLTVAANGTALLTDAAASVGTIANGGRINFSNLQGDVTVGSLTGSGIATFAGDSSILSGITAGSIQVGGDLVTPTISGGTVSAAMIYNILPEGMSSVDVSGGKVSINGRLGGSRIGALSGGELDFSGPVIRVANMTAGKLATTGGETYVTLVSGGLIQLDSASVALGTVSGGLITLDSDASNIDVLNGGTLVNQSALTISAGSSNGSISGTGSLTKSGSQSLTLTGLTTYSGLTNVFGGTLFVGGSATLANSSGLFVDNGAQASFTAKTGTITLEALSGEGTTHFASNATIRGEISQGTVEAGSGRLTASISGGEITAAALSATAVSGGTITLKSGASSITQLTNGSINLEASSGLSVSTGTFLGTLTGSGTLTKTGASTLALTATPAPAISVNVQGGSLNVDGLLREARSVSVSANAQLNTAITTGTYSGRLAGAGSTFLTGTGTLTLGNTGFIQGGLTLGSDVTLDVSLAGDVGVDPATSFTLLSSSQLVLNGAGQRLELLNLALSLGSKLVSNSGTILYDTAPVYLNAGTSTSILDANNQLLSAYTNLISGSLTFEENSKKGAIFTGGTYEFIAGRVKDLPIGVEVKRLLLDPLTGKTVRITSEVTVTQEVVATATGSGFVSVGTLVTTPKFVIGTGIQATFADSGSLSSNGVFVNNGTLQFSVASGSKPVPNLISGTGTIEKLDAGTLALSGANTYSGLTRLSGGVLQLNNSAAIGTGAILFNGGGLKYGDRVTADLSGRISTIGEGTVAALDTGANTVTFASVLSGKGGLSKSGSGTLVLAAEETFSGELLVSEGLLKVGNGTAGSLAASIANVASGAALSFSRSDAITYAGSLTGAGRVEQAGNGQLSLTGDGSGFTGTFELSNGITLLGGSGALAEGVVTFKGGTLKYGTSEATDLSERISALTTTALVDTSVYDVNYGYGLSGAAGLTKYGVSTLTLSGLNTYQGTTTVAAGSLRYTGAGLTSAGTVSTQANTTVILENNGSDVSFSGAVSGVGRLVKNGSGTITIAKSQTNSGGVTLNGGSLALQNSAVLGGAVTLKTGSTLDLVLGGLNPNTALAFQGGSLRLGAAVVTVTSLDLTLGSILYAGIADDSATIYYSQKTDGAVSIPEAVTLLEYTKNADGSPAPLSGPLKGTLSSLPDTSSLTVKPNTNGKLLTIAVDGGLNLGSFTGEAGVNLSITKPVNVDGDFRLMGGSFALSGSLTSNGSVVLGSGTSAAVTGTINSGGSIKAKELTLTGTSILTLNDNAALRGVQTLQVGARSLESSDVDRANDATLVIPAGTLTLVEGQTLKGSGRIVGNVTVGDNSVLSPGNSPGTLFVVGSLTLTSGTVRIEVGGLGSGTLIQDRISTSGSLVIGGTSGEGPTFQIIDTDGSLSNGGSLGTLFVSGTTTVAVVPTILNQGTLTFARQSSSLAVLPSVMYRLQPGPIDLNALKIDRLRFASFAGSASNIAGFATALDTRILTQRATSDGLLELGTGIANKDAVPAQLAAALPVAYAELAALSTQRTLNLHQGLVSHFSSLRANLTEAPEAALTVWTTGYGASHKQDGNRSIGTAGFTASSWGEMFGVEQRIGGFLLGVTGAAGHTSATFANNPGRASTDSWHGGLYGALDLDGLVIESGALFGATDTTARRTISATGLTTREGRVKLNGSEWLANLGVAKPLAASAALTITPSVRVIAQGQSQSAASESDLSGLEVSLAKQKTTTFQHQAGVELRRKLSLAGLPAAASLQLDWIHNYNAKGRNLDMALSGNSSASYGYKGSDSGADSIHIGAAFEAALTERTTLRLGGEYQSQTSLSTARGSVSIGYQF